MLSVIASAARPALNGRNRLIEKSSGCVAVDVVFNLVEARDIARCCARRLQDHPQLRAELLLPLRLPEHRADRAGVTEAGVRRIAIATCKLRPPGCTLPAVRNCGVFLATCAVFQRVEAAAWNARPVAVWRPRPVPAVRGAVERFSPVPVLALLASVVEMHSRQKSEVEVVPFDDVLHAATKQDAAAAVDEGVTDHCPARAHVTAYNEIDDRQSYTINIRAEFGDIPSPT